MGLVRDAARGGVYRKKIRHERRGRRAREIGWGKRRGTVFLSTFGGKKWAKGGVATVNRQRNGIRREKEGGEKMGNQKGGGKSGELEGGGEGTVVTSQFRKKWGDCIKSDFHVDPRREGGKGLGKKKAGGGK